MYKDVIYNFNKIKCGRRIVLCRSTNFYVMELSCYQVKLDIYKFRTLYVISKLTEMKISIEYT